MAAPIYTQAEAEALILMRKVTALPRSKSGDEPTDRRPRSTRNESRRTLAVEPDNASSGAKFEVELCQNLHTQTYSITLFVQLPPRPMKPICRYEIQDGSHHSPSWANLPPIASGQPHAHIYSERAEREEDMWCRCARPVDFGVKHPLEYPQEVERLKGAFFADMNIHFHAPELAGELFKP